LQTAGNSARRGLKKDGGRVNLIIKKESAVMKPFNYSRLHEPVFIRRIGKFASWLLPKLYKPLVIIGKENIPETGAFIVACNHLNARDPVPIMLAAYPKREIHFMGKDKLFSNPLAGRILRRSGAFPVNRGMGARKALDYSMRILRSGRALGIFPEGTRHPGMPPQEPCSGIAKLAYESGAPVLICAIFSNESASFGDSAYLRFGRLIKNSELDFGDGRAQGRKRAAKQIMDEITAIWKDLKDEYGENNAQRNSSD
jgi:1-acyl-sn-glycerol-3-phosphate acyltransferase